MATQVPAHAHEDFLRLFHSREAKLRGKPAVDALNNAQHAALRKKLESVHFIPPVWSLATQKGVVDTAKRRERYCNDQNLGDWQTELLEAGESIKSIAMGFLLWICERSAVRSYGTTWVYFRMHARPEKRGKRKICMRDGRPGFFCVSPPDARVGTAAAAGA
ncbi:uncharacterized protein B0I36DRAFT_336774 [Microdochium trichocladiopsis]|uniref:Uncharacterized protein n=1 Tax=Microdochium trichocladiopsis TaxID=1682393 RepID=A0A9P8XUF5_9PEZI|nr:uncharacterized protein B0I36DRAFT_336774 [Microdochium trichocladiopsis]KAH7016124.1 hypothetical protein B0I36DRAFT_336774 [Microdochium trichocladiopsis]